MTKKHFIQLADAIIKANGFAQMDGRDLLFTHEAQHRLADFCAAQNSRFDRTRWLGYIAGTQGPSGSIVKKGGVK